VSAVDIDSPLPLHLDDDAARTAGMSFLEEALRVLACRDDGPVSPAADRWRSMPPVAAPQPEGLPIQHVIRDLRDAVIGWSIRLQHPMYMGHQVCPPLPAAALAEPVVSALNQSQAIWDMSPGTTMVELSLLRWFAGLASWDPGVARGTFVSGGSAANLTALLAARAERFPDSWRAGTPPGLVLLAGEQAHYSVARAAGILGMGTDAVIAIPSDEEGRTSPAAAAGTLARLAAEDRPVLALVATAGSTATGSHDDLRALAHVAADAGAWLHVDGAHGASALLSARHRGRMDGIEAADSLSWDPHKMMYQPLSAAVLLVRRGAALERAFSQDAGYLFQPSREDGGRPPDLGAWTLQCSRRADALRLWLTLRLHGTRILEALYDRAADLAAALWDKLDGAPDFEPLHRPHSNILCFRHVPGREEDAGWQDRLRREYNASGRGWITGATLRGRRALRVTLINPATTAAHLDRLLEGLREAARTCRRDAARA
jgi:L-2,4-diaminobutyrate decarboxylase